MRIVIKNYKTEQKSVELMSFCTLLIILTKNLQFRESMNYNQANTISEHDESNLYFRIEAQRQMLHQKIKTLWTSAKHEKLKDVPSHKTMKLRTDAPTVQENKDGRFSSTGD